MSFPVGSLIRARDREWVVLPESDDEMLIVRPLGGTDDEITGLLRTIETITPATFPPPDPNQVGDFRSGRLLRDALRLGFRSSAGPFRSLGHIAVTPRPYQLVPLLMALKLDPVRMLIADDVGVGKTIEALLIARELLDQGDIHRVAVLCSPQLAEQWQREMQDKFHIDSVLVLPSTVRKLERGCPVDRSLFDVYPHVVVSTDFIKSDRRRMEFLRTCPEFVIVDEAHTAVDAGGAGRGRHQRHELLKGLARDADRHLLLVTATPHSGKEEAFRALLALLSDELADLPDDLSGPENEYIRRRLARHFVQRRRADIRSYLGEDTTFPERETAEETYRLTDAYRRLFDRTLQLARETVADESGDLRQRRVRWWSALALLRSLASSPAAAVDTLRNRASTIDAGSVEEADEIGRRAVLDLPVDEGTEGVDVAPGADVGADSDDRRYRRRLQDLAREAEQLFGAPDAKLQKAIRMVRALLDDGFNPILFCRFIPTAEYVAEALADALPGEVAVEAVTGRLPPEEREARVDMLGRWDGPRVLVATDCLAEGVNLQHHFNAVVHYDLSWNPTKHEQREGRVDRYGQPSPVVRAVTYYGLDNQIDGLVLDVLIRKHETIRATLGISVPVPVDSDQAIHAIMEGLLLRGRDPDQLQFDEVVASQRDELFAEWERAAEREKRSRTMFAQRSIKVDDVARELEATRQAIGSETDVERFIRDTVVGYGGRVSDRADGALEIDPAETPRAVREAIGRTEPFRARFALPVTDQEVYLSRTHPIVENLARHILDAALDPATDSLAARAGAIRTSAVTTRTTLLVVRFRFHLLTVVDGQERPLLAEDAKLLGFEGSPENHRWLDSDQLDELLDAEPEANIGPDQAARFVARVVDGIDHLSPHLEATARTLADRLVEQHRRIRDAARRRGVTFRAEPHLPPDLLGIYVLLPTVT